MVYNLTTLEGIATSSLHKKIIAMRKPDNVYVLSLGQKNTTMFVPLLFGTDYKYKCKNAESSIRAALQNDEKVFICQSFAELSRELK